MLTITELIENFTQEDKHLTTTRLPDMSRKLVIIITFEEANTDTIGYLYTEDLIYRFSYG